MQHLDDWELVALAQGGDLDAFAILVQRYQGPLVHFCMRMAGSRQDAEDLAQEAFLRLYRHLKKLAPRARFSTVIFGFARNLTLNHIRDEKRRGRDKAYSLEGSLIDIPAGDQADKGARHTEMTEAIETGLMKLSVEHREVLLLREFQGMDYNQIATIVGCRKGTVRSRLARAREQLRQQLEALGNDLL